VDNDIVVWGGLFVWNKGFMRYFSWCQLCWIFELLDKVLKSARHNLSLWKEKKSKKTNQQKRGKKKEKECWIKKKQNNTRISYRFHIRYTSTLSGIVDQLGAILCIWDVFVWGVCLWNVGRKWFLLIVFGLELYKCQHIVPLLPLPIVPLQPYQSLHDYLVCSASQ